jgi:hypothetical protein
MLADANAHAGNRCAGLTWEAAELQTLALLLLSVSTQLRIAVPWCGFYHAHHVAVGRA